MIKKMILYQSNRPQNISVLIIPISKSGIISDSIIVLKNNIYYKGRHCCGLLVVEYLFLNTLLLIIAYFH